MPDLKPHTATLFAFNVGFGDCSLLRFSYPDGAPDKHILIDFGSKRYPKSAPSNFLDKVAAQIKDLCGGKLDVIIATHRHQDHISGFSTSGSRKSKCGRVIASCEPGLILQPWTEHPDIATDAVDSFEDTELNQAFISNHLDTDDLADYVVKLVAAEKKKHELQSFKSSKKTKQLNSLEFMGENAVKNKSAVKNLMAMGKKTKAQYLRFGDEVDLSSLIPGITLDILGPPTTAQRNAAGHSEISVSSQNWAHGTQRYKAAVGGLGKEKPKELFKSEGQPPLWARWAIRRMQKYRHTDLLDMVTRLDNHLNDTSLISLISVGDKSLLFPGDAEWENWSYALEKDHIKEKLKSVDLYKVGHHGSRNATPKSKLWPLFENRCNHDSGSRLITLLSTKHGVYDKTEEGTIPKPKLVEALRTESDFYSTEDHSVKDSNGIFYREITMQL